MNDLGLMFDALRSSGSTKFVELARIAGLDPKMDFRFANLRNSNFSNQDLQEFDFSHSILNGSNFRSATFNQISLEAAEFFDWSNPSGFSRHERLFGNLSILANRYYQRIASTAALAISRPDHSVLPIIDALLQSDKSLYHRKFSEHVRSILNDKELNKSSKRLHIARAAAKQTYPLDRQKYMNVLREFGQIYPTLKSYFPNL